MLRTTRTLAAAAAVALLAAACGGAGSSDTDTADATDAVAEDADAAEDEDAAEDAAEDADAPEDAAVVDLPAVVATTTIVADLVRDVAGDAAVVTALIAPGVDPHDAAPSASQAAELRSADLVVAVGGGLEEGYLDALAAAEDDGVTVLELAEVVDDPLEPGEGAHDHGDDHGHDHGDEDKAEGDDHDHGSLDPHVWLDPVRAAGLLDDIAEALEAVAPGGGYEQRAEARAAELEALDAELAEVLAAVPDDQRVLVTDHDGFGYFADRYGFEVMAVRVGATDASAEAIATLAQEVIDLGLTAVFAEAQSDDRLVRTIAGEAGVEVATLFSGSLDEGAETYDLLMTANAERIAAALG